MQCVIFCRFVHHKSNCSPVTRYHDNKLTVWLLWLTSTVMSFRRELFSPCRQCGLFDKSSIAVLLTQTCGLQAFFLVTQHFLLFFISQLFLPFQVLTDLKQINSFWLLSKVFIYRKGRAACNLWFGAWLNEFTSMLFKDFIYTWRLGLFLMQSDFGWETNVPITLSLLYPTSIQFTRI